MINARKSVPEPIKDWNPMKAPSALRFLAGCVALLSLVTVAYAGGGDLVTVKDFPDFAVAGKTLELTFTVWVPSLEPLTGLHPVVHATDAKGRAVRAIAKASTVTGEYTTALILPEPGEWVLALDTEYESAATLPPLKVIAPGTPAPDPFSLTTRGLRLFTAKGCYGCHFHEEVNGGRAYGPDLTGKRFAPEYLKNFLVDPSITPVPEMVCSRSVCGSPYPMPNLNLKDAEIEALVAFITKK
jgi:mono/diheme cytochrome c family protein